MASNLIHEHAHKYRSSRDWAASVLSRGGVPESSVDMGT